MAQQFQAPLKIALIAPLAEAVPPRLYGGTERVVAHLADSLVDLGHAVTLFATADARTSARLVAVREQAIRLDPTPLKSDVAAHLALLHEVRRRADEFDVLHFHIDLLHFPFFEHLAARTLTTLHGRLDLADLPDVYRRWPAYPLVSISDSQRRPLPSANWAQRAAVPLKLAAKVDLVDAAYFREVVAPLLKDPLVEFLGEIDDSAKNDFLGGARALIFPIDWPEPFGLVMIEAMACGTPVIAWDIASVPEIVEDGVTGFIVRSVDEAVTAVQRIDTLDRARIRAAFERRFSVATMSKNYLGLYSRLCRPAASARGVARGGSDDLAGDPDGALRA